MNLSNQDLAKKKAAESAFSKIHNGQKLGIGTGSTVKFLIDALLSTSENLDISLAFSSIKSESLLQHSHYKKLSPSLPTGLDITIDGADYVSNDGILIKGGGGALTREKILVSASKKSIIIIDESKYITSPKKIKLPVEILSFGHAETIRKISSLEFDGELRKSSNNQIFITDNGNYIFDIEITFPNHNIKQIHHDLKNIVGVVETGVFFGFPYEIWIAFFDEKKAIQIMDFSN